MSSSPLERALVLANMEDMFMDSLFDDMDRPIARMHHDLRGAMARLTPQAFLSSREGLADKAKQLRSAVTLDKDGLPHLDLTMDLSNYRPEEIEVKVKGHSLVVEAKHEEKHGRSCINSVVTRYFELPEGTDVENIKPKLSKDGVLTIKGPLPKESSKTLPITQDE